MLFTPIPVPEVTVLPWVAYELACTSLERSRSMQDREEMEFDFTTIDISHLEKAGLL